MIHIRVPGEPENEASVMACCADNVINLQLMPTLYNDHCQGLERTFASVSTGLTFSSYSIQKL